MTENKEEYLFEGELPKEGDNDTDVYPDAVLNISRDTFSVFQMKRKWEKDPPMLNLSPPFQRNLVWKVKQKSELIESMVMGIPLPAFYVKEDNKGVYIVVDGKQRLTSLFEFIDGKFKLSKLNVLRKLEGKGFNDLSPVEQNKIEDYTLLVNVIKAPTSDRVTFDLFDRVNRGGTHLNNQEMRNALYQGGSTKLLEELAELECFKRATERSIPPIHMKDRLLILRFLAFYLYREGLLKLTYRSNIDDFLGKAMEFINQHNADGELMELLKNVFEDAMTRAVKLIIPKGGFRLPAEKGKNKRPINMAFFESFGYLLAKSHQKSDSFVISAYKTLLGNEQFIHSLTYSVDNSNQTEIRYKLVSELLNNPES